MYVCLFLEFIHQTLSLVHVVSLGIQPNRQSGDTGSIPFGEFRYFLNTKLFQERLMSFQKRKIAYFHLYTRNYFSQTASMAHRKITTVNLLATKVVPEESGPK